MAKEKKIYCCPMCDCEYDSLDGAKDCCDNEIEFETKWLCEKCDEDYYDEHDADECCANETLDKFDSRKSREGGNNK